MFSAAATRPFYSWGKQQPFRTLQTAQVRTRLWVKIKQVKTCLCQASEARPGDAAAGDSPTPNSEANKENSYGQLHAPADGAATYQGVDRPQAVAYAVLALLHIALAAVTTLAPGWSLRALFGFPATTATSLQLINAGAYLWLFAACLVCLKDAALHHRLKSDTYLRLNLGVMYQCVVVILLLMRHNALLAGHVLGCGIAVFGITAYVAGRGYAGGAGGFSLPTIIKAFLSNLQSLWRSNTPVSVFYGASAALALLQFLWHYPTTATPLFSTDLGPVALLLKQARGAGMVLAGVVWFTLKDAADRGRLAASTFRQLNLSMAMLAALQLWGLWQMAYLGVPLNDQLWKALVSTGVLVVLVCDWQYFFARTQIA